jgi:hypothetical protein
VGVAALENMDERGEYRAWVVRLDGKRPLGRHKRRGMIIVKWVFKKWDGEAWTGSL